MRDIRTERLLGLVVAALAVPVGVAAQQMEVDVMPDGMDTEAAPFEFDVRAGLAFPVEDLTDYADPGYHFGSGAAWWVNDHVGLRVAGGVSAFDGATPETVEVQDLPDMRLWTLGAGLEFDLTGRQMDRPWGIQTNVGVGSTTMTTDGFLNTDPDTDATPTLMNISETYPNVNGGVELSLNATQNIEVAVGASMFYTFADGSDLEALREVRSPATGPLDHTVSMPLTASIQVDLPNR